MIHSLCLPFLPGAQAIRENNVEMFKDMRAAVDGVDPNRDTFAYSDK